MINQRKDKPSHNGRRRSSRTSLASTAINGARLSNSMWSVLLSPSSTPLIPSAAATLARVMYWIDDSANYFKSMN
jgi:hypothetical protein